MRPLLSLITEKSRQAAASICGLKTYILLVFAATSCIWREKRNALYTGWLDKRVGVKDALGNMLI